MENILIELENNLKKKFMNIDIHNYDHGNFEELFKLVAELVNRSFITCSYTVADTSIDNEYIHLIFNNIDHKHLSENTLSILLGLQYFIIIDIEVSILH